MSLRDLLQENKDASCTFYKVLSERQRQDIETAILMLDFIDLLATMMEKRSLLNG